MLLSYRGGAAYHQCVYLVAHQDAWVLLKPREADEDIPAASKGPGTAAVAAGFGAARGNVKAAVPGKASSVRKLEHSDVPWIKKSRA